MKELEVTVNLVNDKVQLAGVSRNNKEVIMDYFPPLGDADGYTGLEMLLMSLAGCSSTSIIALLRKMKKTVNGFKVTANGIRRDEHPTSFEKIKIEFQIVSDDADAASVEKAIQLSEQSLCPVWCMLKNGVEISTNYKISSKS